MPQKKGNQRGARFATVEEFESAAKAYFDDCDAAGKLYGEAGLALHLGVTLKSLRAWYDGERGDKACPGLQEAVQMAYLRIQDQIETHEAYREKGGMASRAIFLQKQVRFGGYQDRIEARQDMTVNIKHGKDMDSSDFK